MIVAVVIRCVTNSTSRGFLLLPVIKQSSYFDYRPVCKCAKHAFCKKRMMNVL